jgi:dTMP kinase
VISDRFLDSSLAYQGGARSVGVEEVARVNHFATGGLVPDLTFFLDLDPVVAATRAGGDDRFESEGLELQRRVSDSYRRLAEAEPERWRAVEAEASVEEIHAEMLETVRAALAGAPA